MDVVRLFGLVVVGAVNGVLALAVLVRDRRSAANRWFAGAVLASVGWLVLAFLSDQPRLHAYSLSLNRLTFAASMFMGFALVNFALCFPNRTQRPTWVWQAFCAAGLLLAILAAFTNLVIADVHVRAYGTDPVTGAGIWAYLLWMGLGVVALIMTLARNYSAASGREKAQLKYLMLGIALFTFTSLMLGLVLPMIVGSYAPAILNTFTPLLLFGFTAYAMIRHRLMDMRVVVLRAVLYTLLVVVFSVFYLAVALVVRTQLLAILGISADAAFVLAGVIAVFAFQPLHAALEHVTERMFYRRRHDQQSLLERLSQELVGTADLAKIAGAVSSILSDQFKVEDVTLVTQEPDGLVVRGGSITADDPLVTELLVGDLPSRPLLREEVPDPAIAELLRDRGVCVVVPLSSDDGVGAWLLLGEKRSGEVYTTQDLRFLQLLSPEISIALKTAGLFEQREQRVRELTALNRLASVLGQDLQLEALLNRALDQVIKVAAADTGSIMLLDPATRTLSVRAAYGLPDDVVRDTKVALGDRIAGWVAENRTSLLLVDDESQQFSSELKLDGVKTALSVPLVSKERVIGVLNISRLSSASGFNQQNLSVVTSFAAQLAVAIENAQLYTELEGHVLGTITALAAAVEAKDPYTFGHSSEVTNVTLAIAAEMDLDAEQTETLRMAAILHDIGKIGVEGSILNKPGRLTDEEYESIKRHPSIAANILGSLDFLADVVPIVLHHHERYDGHGYPAGIAGEAIPLGARIICVADAYDAMTSDRPYRAALPREAALAELKKHAGTQFDATVVEAYVRVLGAAEHHPRTGTVRQLYGGTTKSA